MASTPPAPAAADGTFPHRWVGLFTLVASLWTARLIVGLGPVSESDEAIVALMARAIVHGEDLPAFFWGQDYMGTVESWLAAPLFVLFGTSMPLTRAVVGLFSIALVPVGARLSFMGGGRRLAIATAAVLACPPVTVSLWSVRPRGGFLDVVAFGVMVTWLFLRIADGATSRIQERRALAAGAGLGLIGWWNFFGLPLAVPGVLVALLDPRTRQRRLWAMGVVGGLLGGSVLLVSNARNGWKTFEHALHPSALQRTWGQPEHAVTGLAWTNMSTIAVPALLGIGDARSEPRPLGALGWTLLLGAVAGQLASLLAAFRSRSIRVALAITAPGLGSLLFGLAYLFSRFGFVPDPRYELGLWPGIAWGWAWLLASLPARSDAPALVLGGLLLGYQLHQVHIDQTPLEHWVWKRGGTVTLTLAPVTNALLARGIKGAHADYWTAERLNLDSDGAFTSTDPTLVRYPPHAALLDTLPYRCWVSVPWGDAPRLIARHAAVEVAQFPAGPEFGLAEPLVVACGLTPPPKGR